MTEKMSAEDMEVELKKILNKDSRQSSHKTPQMTNTHEIEADLKRMLNMPHSVVVTKEDLLNIKTGKEKVEKIVKETKKPHTKKKEKKPKHPESDQTLHHHHHRQHQEEPFTPGAQDQSQASAKKKKRKPKKKKSKDQAMLTEAQERDEPESEDSEVDEDRPPPQKHFNQDFHRAKYLDDQLTQAILKELEADKIFPLKKKSTKFANAKYFCRLCDYHCDNIPVSRQHANDPRHRRKKEIMLQDKLLRSLPSPSERHIQALDDVVETIYREHGLTDEDMAFRQRMVDQIQGFLRELLPDVSLCMFGSSVSGLGLKTDDLNMDLVLPAGANPALCLSEVYRVIYQSEKFMNVQSDFLSKVPSVLFTSPCGTLQCQITVGSEQSCQTSQYLAIYLKLDERVRKLAATFRYWAKVCEVDRQDAGSLPAYCFGLMTIFYLQQCQPPVLPVLWKDLSEQALKRPKTKADVENMLGELGKQSWTTSNEHTVGTLWKDLLLFYGVHFDLVENIICIRSQKIIPRSEKKWKSRRIAVEDPFVNKRNVARSLQNMRMFDYFYNCLRKTGLYFSLPTSHQNISYYYKCKRKTKYTAKEREKQPKLLVTGSGNTTAKQTVSDTKEGIEIHNDETTVTSQNKFGTSLNEVADGTSEQVSDCEIELHKSREAVECNITQESVLRNETETDSDIDIKENKFFEDCKLNNVTVSSELESSYSRDETDRERRGNLVQFEKLSVKDEDLVEGSKVKEYICEMCVRNQSLTPEDKTDENRAVSDSDSDDSSDKGAIDRLQSSGRKCLNCGMLEPKNVFDSKSDRSNLVSGAGSAVCMNSGNERKVEPNQSPEKTETQIMIDLVDEVIASVVDTCERKADECDVTNEGEKRREMKDQTDKEIEEIIGKDNQRDVVDGSDGETSDSDMETESPESSPVRNRKRHVSSPFGAEYDFKFDSRTFTDGKGPSVFCSICDKEGHLKSSCPEDQLPLLEELPVLTKTHLQMLSSVIKQVPDDFKLSYQEINDREFVRKNLEIHIQGVYPDAQLRLFGSSKNGFGFHQSDLDICVTFKDKEAGDVNFVEHIEAICKSLKTHRGLYAVFPITTAKVPIVKFTHRNSQLEGDISMYNILAMENTRLLSTYASIDPRVQTLGYAMKVFAKVCDIGDASRGSLSSYAYILMMIHYLQHTRPPLIPVLQELHSPDKPKPQRIVEGWNTWFYDDINNLQYVWPGCGKNNQSVGELWLGFFRYYLEEFSFTEQVVTIRQFQSLTKFEKLWNGKCMAIEDPFDIDHNLGGGLTRKMNHYIQCTFVNARRLYGTCIRGKPDGFSTIQDYFFDRHQLVDGELPNDRLCRVCGKIGHIAKECPKLIAKKEREAAEKKRREEMKTVTEQASRGSPQKNSGQRQYNNNRDRQSTGRSLSDPANGGSPLKGQGQQQFYQRQNSQPNTQSPNNRQRRMVHDTSSAERYRGNYQGSGSPHQDFQPQHGSSWRQQNKAQRNQSVQGNMNPGFRQQQEYKNQPNQQQFYSNNRNDNSSPRVYHQGQNRDWNGAQYFVNQNYDLRAQQGDSFNYPPSPNRNQHHPQFRNQFYEGSSQVFSSTGNPESSGFPRVLFTNPPFNIPINVFPSMPPVLVNRSMASNHAYQQPLAQFTATSPPNVGLQNNRIPVCTPPGWFSTVVPMSACDEQPASPGPKTRHEQEVNFDQASMLKTEQISESPVDRERRVNVQKGGSRGKVPDVGITVKNEYYHSKDQG